MATKSWKDWFFSDRPRIGRDVPLEQRGEEPNAPGYDGMPQLSVLGVATALLVFVLGIAVLLRFAG
ncbi:MAG: hypothetical protein QOJ13_1991 [Gaiellales bacterium]|jgi:hypothetical protein|nr:hypothetical protein [Gaiellales bacterium]